MTRMTVRLFGLGFAMLGLFLLIGPVGEWIVSDHCLDLGGSYNYEMQVCDFSTNHRHPPSVISIQEAIGAMLLAVGLGTVVRSFRKHYAF